MTEKRRTALVTTVVCAAALAVVGAIGWATHQPWLFPSLGPTLMVLAETPDQPAALPRNVVVGHLVGIAAGWAALAVTGLLDHPSAVQEGISGPRIVAAVLSLAITACVTVLLGTPHPPAGATTLIISLGVLTQPAQLLVMAASVVVLLLLGLGVRMAMDRMLPGPVPEPTA